MLRTTEENVDPIYEQNLRKTQVPFSTVAGLLSFYSCVAEFDQVDAHRDRHDVRSVCQQEIYYDESLPAERDKGSTVNFRASIHNASTNRHLNTEHDSDSITWIKRRLEPNKATRNIFRSGLVSNNFVLSSNYQ